MPQILSPWTKASHSLLYIHLSEEIQISLSLFSLSLSYRLFLALHHTPHHTTPHHAPFLHSQSHVPTYASIPREWYSKGWAGLFSASLLSCLAKCLPFWLATWAVAGSGFLRDTAQSPIAYTLGTGTYTGALAETPLACPVACCDGCCVVGLPSNMKGQFGYVW